MEFLGGQREGILKKTPNDMTWEGSSEIFKGDFAKMCAKIFRLGWLGDEWTRQVCADGEQGPPLDFILFGNWFIYMPNANLAGKSYTYLNSWPK